MSNVATKNLILSQPKASPNEVVAVPSLKGETLVDDSSVTIKIEVPGVDPSTVNVDCENYILCVSCEKGAFTYSVKPTVDTSKIKADIKWGLLTISIPEPPAPVSRSISVNIHDSAKNSSSAKTKFTSED